MSFYYKINVISFRISAWKILSCFQNFCFTKYLNWLTGTSQVYMLLDLIELVQNWQQDISCKHKRRRSNNIVVVSVVFCFNQNVSVITIIAVEVTFSSSDCVKQKKKRVPLNGKKKTQTIGNLIFDQVLPVTPAYLFPLLRYSLYQLGTQKRTLQLLKYLCMYYLYNLTHKTILLQGMYRIHADVTTLCQDLFIELMVRACYHFYRFCHFNIICF